MNTVKIEWVNYLDKWMIELMELIMFKIVFHLYDVDNDVYKSIC